MTLRSTTLVWRRACLASGDHAQVGDFLAIQVDAAVNVGNSREPAVADEL